MKEQHREGVVLLLEKADGQIAFQLRDDSPAIMYPNHWGLLGGWTEANESPQQAAIREIEEELGYSLDAAKLVYLKTHIDGEVKSHILRYPVTDELRDATLAEGQALRFMALADIWDQNVIPRHREILEWYKQLESFQ
ncbi:MAG TPA: NUDIX domain-containing protein [Anaerolineae bacterium]|nr:NUDIX domain-containing protein [Anaerolineae bacterium]